MTRLTLPGRAGFTLIEAIVVIAVIGLLATLLIPAVQAARESSHRIQCAGNLKQLALACHAYADAHGTLPIGIPMMYDADPALNFYGPSQSLFVSMLGQLDQQPLYNAVNFSRSIFASANATIYATGLGGPVVSQRSVDPDGRSMYLVLRRPVQGEDPVLQLRRLHRGPGMRS